MAKNFVKKGLSVLLVLGLLLGYASLDPQEASACENPFIGEVKMFVGNYAPRDWAFCQGQELSTQQYSALFAIIGTTYGGNGQTSFALPDLRGRVPIGPAVNVPGISIYTAGQKGGVESVSLTQSQMPAHSHQPQAVDVQGNVASPGGNTYPAQVAAAAATPDRQEITINTRAYAQLSGASAQNTAIGPTLSAGGSQVHENMQPYLVINYIIALNGIFPTRD